MRPILLLCILSSAAIAGPKLTAKTTDLYPSTKCKEKIKGGEGQDPVLTCPSAVKGFDVTVSFSAVLTHVTVSGGGKETSFSGLVGKKLEWRLADGKPFALLVELADPDEEKPGKTLGKRIAIYQWGSPTASSELPIQGMNAAAVTKEWAKARKAADMLAP